MGRLIPKEGGYDQLVIGGNTKAPNTPSPASRIQASARYNAYSQRESSHLNQRPNESKNTLLFKGAAARP